jgi:excisionase family DNA binding protein
MMERYITCKQAGDATNTSESFWRKAAARREIPVFRVGRAVRLKEGDVLRFLGDRERPARESAR